MLHCDLLSCALDACAQPNIFFCDVMCNTDAQVVSVATGCGPDSAVGRRGIKGCTAAGHSPGQLLPAVH